MYFVILGFIGIASLLIWYLLRHDHGRQLPVGSLWIASAWGVVAMISAGFLEAVLLPHSFTSSPQTMNKGALFVCSLAVGLIEEGAKFLPLALFIYKKPYFKEHTDGIIYFAICGLTFAVGENILYTLQYGGTIGLSRLILTPFFHATTASILGYYLVSYKINKVGRNRLIAACLAMPLIHGLYDFGLFSLEPALVLMSLVITLSMSIAMFLYFGQANDLDRVLVPITPASANFCTNCGRKNTSQKRFCEYCGHQL